MSKVNQKLKYLENKHSEQDSKELKYGKLHHDDKFKIWWPEAPSAYNNHEKGAYRIESQLETIIKLIKELKLPANSKILDICCGLPILPAKIKKEFPEFEVYGIDIYTDEYDEFEKYSKGCHIYKFPFQMLFEKSYEDNIDFELITMFNSFRAFEEDIKKNILNWHKNNGKLFMFDDLGIKII
tara:strand:- start:180 stop:728 length:549 start_codon:yes stop_codon:yes gene_type:complete